LNGSERSHEMLAFLRLTVRVLHNSSHEEREVLK
jgi:hypothetical protein